MRYTSPRSFACACAVVVASSVFAGDVVVDGSIHAGGMVVSDGAGFMFPDATVQTTAAAPEHRRIVIVSPVGAETENGAALLAAIAGLTPTAAEPYLLKLEPGVYDVGGNQVQTKPYLDVEGSGQQVTRIKGTYPAVGALSGFVQVVSNSEIRMLTVENYGGGSAWYTGIAVWNELNARISDVTVLVHSGDAHSGIDIGGQGTVVRNVTVVASGGTWTVGLWLDHSDIRVDGSWIRAIDGSYENIGVISDYIGARTITNSVIEASGAASSSNTGLRNQEGAEPDVFNSVIRAFGAATNQAIHNYGVPTMPSQNGGVIEIHHSVVSGADLSVWNESDEDAYMAASQVKGPVSITGTGAVKCVGAYDVDYDPLSSTCAP